MPFAPQALIGPYRIVELIATGGMGEVYRGEHTALQRPVAIKVIRTAALGDPTVVRRFSREARLASSLDHPHVCRVYDYQEHDDQPVLVLEYCEGETLKSRLEGGRLAVEEAVTFGHQLADALAHAHEHGLIHRDLKPGNVMLTAGGVKVLDFGLVKRTTPEDARSAPATDSLTDEDARLGTLPYMAPEQLGGREEDERTDIYALGILLFEMLAGHPPFVRRTNAALAASILNEPAPPLHSVAPEAPTLLAHVVDRCLSKDPDDRYQSASALAGELRWLAASRPGATRPWRRVRERVERWGGWIAAAAAAIALVWLWQAQREPTPNAPLALTLVAPPNISFISNHQEAVLAPDGRTIVFSGVDETGTDQLWWRPLDRPTVTRIPNVEGAHTPFWSPSGEIGYFERTGLFATDLAGRAPQRLATVTLESRGATWSSRDVILFSPDANSGIMRVTPGDDPVALTTPNAERGELGHLWPSFVADGEHFVYLVTSLDESVSGIYLASLDDPVGRRLVASTSSAMAAEGHLLFLRAGDLVAQPLDVEAGRLVDRPVTLASSVATTLTLQSTFSVSGTGVIAYARADSKDITELVWRDGAGGVVNRIGRTGRHRNPTLSSDGRLLSVEIYEGTAGNLWWFDLETNRSSRTNDPSLQPVNPVWAPDGDRLLFASPRPDGWGLFRWDRNTPAAPILIHAAETQLMPTDWSPDGQRIVFAERTRRGDYDLLALDLGADSVVALLDGSAEEFAGRVSPSGAYLAYVSNRAGSFEVFVEPLPRTGRSCQVSSGGGWDPEWGGTDRTLHFLTEDGILMSSALGPNDGCPEAPAVELFDTGTESPRRSRNHYAYDPTNQRFLLNARSDDPRTRTIEVLVHWPAALKASPPPPN